MTKEEQDKMYEYGKEKGLTDRLYNMMFSNFRFGVGYSVISEIKKKRDVFRKGTPEYEKYDNEIKVLRS